MSEEGFLISASPSVPLYKSGSRTVDIDRRRMAKLFGWELATEMDYLIGLEG